MDIKSYEAYGLTMALAGNMEGIAVTRVAIPMVGRSMYAISSKDGKVDISIDPEETEDFMDDFRDGIAQLYNYSHPDKNTTVEKLENDKTMQMRLVDILNQNKYQIADFHPNPPQRLINTHKCYLDMFKQTSFASQDFAVLHTATSLSASLYQDLNTTTISEMWQSLNNNQSAVEDYFDMADEIEEAIALIESGEASDINEAFAMLHEDEMEDDDEMDNDGRDK